MIIKKFIGKSEEDAVTAAKKELGEGVVIMNVRTLKKKGVFSVFRSKQIEVTVALEEENVKHAQQEAAKSSATFVQSLASKNNAASQNTYTESIEKRLESLQALLEQQMRKAEEANLDAQDNAENEGKREAEATEETEKEQEASEQEKFIRLLYNTMLDNEVDEKFANQILDDIDKTKKNQMPIDYILTNIYQKIILKFGKTEGIIASEEGAKVVLFLGPTGVGKTTTIAKIASSFSVDEKKRIALLTCDTYRIAAAEQLKIYANILEVPFRVIYTEEELIQAIEDFKEFDYIFVDTAGHSHQNEEQLEKMKSLVDTLKGRIEHQAFLVLSATTKYHDLLKIAEKYQQISDYQLVFTKLDETECMGNLLNVRLSTGAPIAYTAYGQNVPDDIEIFHPQKTVKHLLGGKN